MIVVSLPWNVSIRLCCRGGVRAERKKFVDERRRRKGGRTGKILLDRVE